jgi:hypothetical protein
LISTEDFKVSLCQNIIEIKLPNGTTKRIRVPTAMANSKAAQRAFASGNIGGAPVLGAADYQHFNSTRAARANALKKAKTRV